jgi:hypothetical protein
VAIVSAQRSRLIPGFEFPQILPQTAPSGQYKGVPLMEASEKPPDFPTIYLKESRDLTCHLASTPE